MVEQYDVFICFKNLDEQGRPTGDAALAQGVHDFLAARDLRVFFSNVSLEKLGVSAYKKAIDRALDSARVLVAVGTSAANLDSEWVRYEWDSFFNDVLSGAKPEGRVFVYIKGVDLMDLPRALRQSQAIKHAPGSLEKVYNFIANALGKEPIRAPPVKGDGTHAQPPPAIEPTLHDIEQPDRAPGALTTPVAPSSVPPSQPIPRPAKRTRRLQLGVMVAAVIVVAASVLAMVTLLRSSSPRPNPVSTQAGSQTALTSDELAALRQQVARYSEQIRPLPLAIAGLQSELKALAEHLWNEKSYGPEAARWVASAYRLYAASLLGSPEGTSQRGIESALPWLRRSLELEAGFEDRAELVAAHRFLMDAVIKRPAELEMGVLLRHQIRVALIEAEQADVDAQVDAALEMITTLIRQRESSQPRR